MNKFVIVLLAGLSGFCSLAVFAQTGSFSQPDLAPNEDPLNPSPDWVKNHRYEKTIAAHAPWFACKKAEDCTVIDNDCGKHTAVNIIQKPYALPTICYYKDCVQAGCTELPSLGNGAICENGKCVYHGP